MPETKSPCFSDKDLRNYLTGWSEDDVATQIETHLEHCETCEETLVMLEQDSDTLIERLRESESGENAENSRIASALSKSRGLVPSSQPDAPAPETLPLEAVGSYELIRSIGSGGMGAVYLAKHRELGKTVAIKVVPTRLGENDQRSERFLREMRAAGTLNHPSIVSATDAGREGNVHYLVMEFIDGDDLSRIARATKPIAIADACEVTRLAAVGLDHAHSQGVIHRDIKPSNLMLSRNGELKILDFGLARMGSWEDVPELTTVGQLMGTLDYMSPEQAERPEAVDYRADLYSLGATLFRLLAGRPPLAAAPDLSPLAKLKLLAEHQPPKLDTLRPDLPEELVDLVAQMLDRNPESRPASASHIAEKLQPFCVNPALSRWVRDVADKDVEDNSFQDAPRYVAAAPISTEPPITRQSRWWIAAALLPFLLLAGGLVTIEMQKGRLVITTDRDDVTVQVLKDGKAHRKVKAKKGTTTTRLFAGDYELKIESPDTDIVLNGERVAIKRGETAVRKVQPKRVPASTYLTSRSPLQPGHELEVKGLVDENHSGTYRILADYTVKMHLVGVVSVKGETLQSFEAKLNQLYGKWYSFSGSSGVVELFFSNQTLDQPVPMRDISAASERLDPSAAKQPVYGGQPLDHWLSMLKYEKQDQKLAEAVEAVTTLGKQMPDRREEISSALLDSIVATNAFPQLARLNSEQQYTELMLEYLNGDNQKAKTWILGSGLRDVKSTGRAGLQRITQWIEQNVFVPSPSESNRDLIPACFNLYLRLSVQAPLAIRQKCGETLRMASIDEPRTIPTSLWVDYDGAFLDESLRQFRLFICTQVIADQTVSNEELTRAVLRTRIELQTYFGLAGYVQKTIPSFADTVCKRLLENIEDPMERIASEELSNLPSYFANFTMRMRWMERHGLRDSRRIERDQIRVYTKSQLCMLITDLGSWQEGEDALRAVAKACEPAIKRLGDKDADPATRWRVFETLEGHRSDDAPNDYFDVILATIAVMDLNDNTETAR